MAGRLARSGLTWAVWTVLVLLIFGPFYWVAASSFKPAAELISRTPTLYPHSWTLVHYQHLFELSPYMVHFRNSWIVAVGTLILTTALALLASYGLYRFEFTGRRLIFLAILSTYLFPVVTLLVPIYKLFTALRLVNNPWGIIVLNVDFALPFSIWLLGPFFRAVPREVEEAAQVDGATDLGVLWRVVLPMVAPGVATVAIYGFVVAWTEYAFSSTLLLSEQVKTLPLGLDSLIAQYRVDWGMMTAASTLTALPVALLFGFIGRYFVHSLAGSIK